MTLIGNKKIGGTKSLIVLMLLISFLAAACSEDDDRDSLPDWSEGYEDTLGGDDDDDTAPDLDASVNDNDNIQEGLTADLPEGSFGLGIPAEAVYPVRLRKLNTVSQPCAITPGESAEITCIMEMDELDMAGVGITYDIVAPEGMCDFVLWSSHLFENWEVGTGPTEVSWTVDYQGNILNEVNAHDGEPNCSYDYTEIDGPNCCYGEYTQTVTHLDGDGGVGEVTVTHGEWGGGRESDCYEGAGFIDLEPAFDNEGFPAGKYMYVNRQKIIKNVKYDALLAIYAIASPMYKDPTIPLANYWDPADHNGTMPAAYTGTYSQPYYEFECADDAWEIIARIHLIVREWNEESEFDKDGDPDTTGLEPGWGDPIDDLADWKAITPGDEIFPQIYTIRLE